MQAKNVLYAAVGAPVVAARKVNDKVVDLRTRISKETSDYTKVAEKAIDGWAAEGEKVVTRVTDNKTVEELAARVDLDQAKEQVGKLRTQLEDMLATWRSSFRPEKAEASPATATPTSQKPAAKPAAKKPAAKKPAAKAAAKKPAAKTATKKPAAKTSAAKSARSTTTKTSSSKPAAAKTAKAS